MKAMLLAAGRGERMHPLTQTLPKAVIPVLGRPIAAHILRRLHCHGIREAVLNLHHLPEVVQDALGHDATPGLPALSYSFEEQLLGTGGGLRRAAPLLRDGDPVLVSNTDSLCDVDLRAVLERHRSSDALATLVLAHPRPGYATVDVDRSGRVVSLAGEPRVDRGRVAAHRLFTGLQVIEPELLDRIPDHDPSCLVRDVYRPLAAEGRLGSFFHEGFWWEFGNPELYLEGSMLILGYTADRRRRVTEEHDPVRRIGSARVALGAAAELHPSVELVGDVALGFACRVGEGTRIESSVIMPEAWIGPGCRLRGAIIGQGVELPAGTRVERGMVCADPGCEVPPAIRREGGLLYSDLAARAV